MEWNFIKGKKRISDVFLVFEDQWKRCASCCYWSVYREAHLTISPPITYKMFLVYTKPHHHRRQHHSVLPNGRSFTANSDTKAAVLPKGRSSTVKSGTKVAVLLGCCSFPLLSAHHSLFSIWTDFKRSEKFPGAPVWRWGEWICLLGPPDFTEIHHSG